MKPSYVQLICQQKKMLSLVSESLFSLVSSSFFSGCLWILTLLRWLRIKSRCCSNSESNSYHTVCIDNGDDYCSEDCSSGPSFISSYSIFPIYKKVTGSFLVTFLAPAHTGRNCFNLFQISFSANTTDTDPGVSGGSKDQKNCDKSKTTHCQVDHSPIID